MVHTKEVKMRELNTKMKERRREEEKETERQPSRRDTGERTGIGREGEINYENKLREPHSGKMGKE